MKMLCWECWALSVGVWHGVVLGLGCCSNTRNRTVSSAGRHERKEKDIPHPVHATVYHQKHFHGGK